MQYGLIIEFIFLLKLFLMNNRIILPLAIIFIALTSCNSSRFTTANNMSNIYGSVYLNNGRVLDGSISVSLENTFGSRDFIRFTPKNGGKEKQKIYIEEMEGMEIRGSFYAPKSIDEGFLSGDRMLFVKRLTKANSRIQLYELHKQRTNTSNRYGNYTEDDYYYYLTLPGQDRYKAWSLSGKHLVPNFEDKMSDYVKDCPQLAQKIKNKEKGYFYAQVSLGGQKRIETILNIIDEYNACR